MKFKKYLTEAKRKSIPKVKGKGKYNFAIKFVPDGWYQNPKMAGHSWAKETVDKLEEVLNTYSKSKLQKWVLDNVYGTPQQMARDKYWKSEDSWHFFNQTTKKDIANLQYTLRRIDSSKKEGMSALLYRVQDKTGVLKNRLIWALEILAYKYDKENYLKWYMREFGLLGMQPDEAMDRFERYHKGISKKIDGQAIGLGKGGR